jgi:hypothetical protein
MSFLGAPNLGLRSEFSKFSLICATPCSGALLAHGQPYPLRLVQEIGDTLESLIHNGLRNPFCSSYQATRQVDLLPSGMDRIIEADSP